MSKEMVISANPHETRVAIMEEGQLCEYYVEREKEFALVGSIYKGRVTRVLPGMQSAFVEIGLDSDAFLYVSDFLEGIEEFDPIVTTVEEKVHKMEEQGGHVFAPDNPAAPAIEPSDVEAAPLAPIPFRSAETSEAVSASQPAPSPASPAIRPHSGPPASDRPRFENRGRHGRDSGRRGGRRGRFDKRGGSSGGGGRSSERHFSRELPSSKYASPGAVEDHSNESPLPEGYVPTILPGESLAKYREKPAAAAAPPPVTNEIPSEVPKSSTPDAIHEGLEPNLFVPQTENVVETPPPAREYRASSTGLEPLPGETLSKWSQQQHSEPSQPEVARPVIAPAPVFHEPLEEEDVAAHHAAPAHHADIIIPRDEAREDEAREDEAQRIHEAEAVDEAHASEELSEDEAAAVAQHVAEAQVEEEAREAHRREFTEGEEGVESAAHSDEPVALDEVERDMEESDHLDDEIAVSADSETTVEIEESVTYTGEMERIEQTEILDANTAPGEIGSAQVAPGAEAPEKRPWKAHIRDDSRARMQQPRRGRDRGRRDDRGGRKPQHSHGHSGHRPQPQRPQLIADMLKQGQEIIVQIAKEPLGKKGARITSHVALPGRFLVYMPTLDHTGVSRKIASAEDRARLRHLVNDAKGSAGGGFIVRTAAGAATPEEVRADVEFLTRTWSEIKTRSEQRKAPSLLHRDLNLVERILRDYITPDFGAIWVDSEEEYTKVVDFMSRFQPQLVNRVKLYTKETPVFEEFGIQQEIDKGLRPKVWLKSGGYIVINHTEALVAIDVNTGKFVGKGSNRLEDTIVRTNLEAVKEIVRQMRLRDLGGIIIIDFIDMEERRNREKVMASLEDALRADRAPSKMLRFNEFGLIAITRKRTKQALERTLCQPCPYCTGSGMVKSIPTLCYEIQTEARKMAPEVGSGSLTLRVHPEISKALKTRESSLVEELENWTKKSIIIQADPTLHWEQYDIY
jgi:Rne/Rng family ribonuclease